MDELVVNVMNTPVEAIESEFRACRALRAARDLAVPEPFAAASVCAGSGALADETSVNLRMDRFKFSSAACSAPSRRGSQAVLNPGGAAERALTRRSRACA